MIEVDVPMIEVEDLPSYGATVTAWRSARGVEARTGHTARSIKRWRLAWSPTEAADLAGISVRTVHEWKRGSTPICDPTFVAPKMGIERPRYVAGDVLRLRLAYDLREYGLSTHVARLTADDADGGYHNPDDPESCVSFAEYLAIQGPRWLVPADDATADFLQATYHGVLVRIGAVDDPDDGHQLVEHPDLHAHLLEYPIARRVKELGVRAGAWWAKVRVPPRERPPWMT